MYYSMNDMKEQLTTNGVMVSHGDVVATEVIVDHNLDSGDIRYSYRDDAGLKYGTINRSQTTLFFDKEDKIHGVLTKPDSLNDWYLFWNNN
jgi:hypothetical protein